MDNKKMKTAAIIAAAAAMCFGTCLARPHGGPRGGFGGPRPMMRGGFGGGHHHHHHHSYWGRGGRGFWPGFVGGVGALDHAYRAHIVKRAVELLAGSLHIYSLLQLHTQHQAWTNHRGATPSWWHAPRGGLGMSVDKNLSTCRFGVNVSATRCAPLVLAR